MKLFKADSRDVSQGGLGVRLPQEESVKIEREPPRAISETATGHHQGDNCASRAMRRVGRLSLR